LKNDIFNYINEGEELVEEPFKRLVEQKQLYSYRYKGFWESMDTFKDKINFDRRYAIGDAPWEVWNHKSR
jgi:glucose-1-phosphate cytidylyltransferase